MNAEAAIGHGAKKRVEAAGRSAVHGHDQLPSSSAGHGAGAAGAGGKAEGAQCGRGDRPHVTALGVAAGTGRTSRRSAWPRGPAAPRRAQRGLRRRAGNRIAHVVWVEFTRLQVNRRFKT